MNLPGLLAIMHPHDKARLDGALNRANRLKREQDKRDLRKAEISGLEASTVLISPLHGAPFASSETTHAVGNAELDAGVPNHFAPNKRGFSPR